MEAASNDGTVLQSFQSGGLRVQGVEPAANIATPAIEAGIPTLVDFFDTRSARDACAKSRGQPRSFWLATC